MLVDVHGGWVMLWWVSERDVVDHQRLNNEGRCMLRNTVIVTCGGDGSTGHVVK